LRFLVDASCNARIATHLRTHGHDATRVGSDYPPDLPDLEILQIAHREQRTLVTDDRDFGELVYRLRHPHAGVIFLRMATDDIRTQCTQLDAALAQLGSPLDQIVVVSNRRIRIRTA
jgi:predicted nuclease of predicted toxin-antitoxin system